MVLIMESVYQLVTCTSSAVLGWLAEKYFSWKLRRERSSSASAVPHLSENITLPATGLLMFSHRMNPQRSKFLVSTIKGSQGFLRSQRKWRGHEVKEF